MAEKPMEPRDPTKLFQPRRPFLLTLLFWVFMLWTVLGFLRFARAIMDRTLIMELFSPAMFWYLVVAGLIWGFAGLPVLWGLTLGAFWAPKLIWVMAFLFPALYWFERLVLWRDDAAQGNWPFMLLLTFLWFGLTVWALRSAHGRQFFEPQQKG